ncbi:MerR-type HTH domain containing protein [uncultured Caudovirales phage]|uniref:MerR-type HTH domain containing protein n=1 Tax=uncultured Caudovirales phage TaxID=2100421 RepID=A0A6J5RHH2_9CAUD|nr:MerR-type HTH domain containing protein [uncultured Caudovirales phage]
MSNATASAGEYRTVDVCNLTGLSYRQLAHWASSGLFIPSIMAPNGSGSRSLYSNKDVYIARLLSDIIDLVGPLRNETLAAVVVSARVVMTGDTPETVYVTLGDESSAVSLSPPDGIAHIVIHPSPIIMKAQSDAEEASEQ